MAMVRRQPTSRSELYLGSYGGRGYGYGHQVAVADHKPEFREEDLWSIVDREPEDDAHGSYGRTGNTWGARRDQEGIKRSRRDSRHVGGLSLAFHEGKTPSARIVYQYMGVQENEGGGDSHPTPPPPTRPRRQRMATSAPVNVPDWNRILRVNSVESINESDDSGDGFDDLEPEEWAPPHEYLARSRKSAAMSVFEGVGRTLKGREMSRLRDAVWSQTGFDG